MDGAVVFAIIFTILSAIVVIALAIIVAVYNSNQLFVNCSQPINLPETFISTNETNTIPLLPNISTDGNTVCYIDVTHKQINMIQWNKYYFIEN